MPPPELPFLFSGGQMKGSQPAEVTRLLRDWRDGNRDALDQLMPLVYDELRRLARRQMRHQAPGHTLQTTAVVNEAYLRLVDQPGIDWQDRAHFFAVAAQAMRYLLVDHARSQHAAKRGGAAQHVELDEVAVLAPERSAELVALDEALSRLAALDPRQGQIVELRYFGGLSLEETAKVMGISAITVRREWTKAKAWLYRELSGRRSDDA
jgi:RNA polymerase sigma-70 factor (ECF subfamily)